MKDKIFSFFDFFVLTFRYDYAVYSKKNYLIAMIVNPLLRIVFFGIITGYSYGTNNSEYIIANIFLLSFSTTFFGVGINLLRERLNGTLQYLELSQLNKIYVIIGKTSYYFATSIITFTFNVIVCNIFLNLNLTLLMILYLIISAIVLAVSTCAFGLMLGAFGFLFKDVNFLYNIIEYIVIILCGANFSTEVFPSAIRITSKFLPVTNTLLGVRGLLANDLYVWCIGLGIEIILAVFFSICSITIYKVCSVLSIKKATLDLY